MYRSKERDRAKASQIKQQYAKQNRLSPAEKQELWMFGVSYDTLVTSEWCHHDIAPISYDINSKLAY